MYCGICGSTVVVQYLLAMKWSTTRYFIILQYFIILMLLFMMANCEENCRTNLYCRYLSTTYSNNFFRNFR